MADFRSLCIKLADDLSRYHHSVIEADGYGCHVTEALLRLSDEALTEPQPPADGEVGELVAWLHGQDGGLGRRAIYSRIADLLQRLAQDHVPDVTKMVEPTDEDLNELFVQFDPTGQAECWRGYARAVLVRWGRPAPQPIPATEWLPEAGDCDAEGRCWLLTVEDDYPQWRLHSTAGAEPGGSMIWVPVDSSPGVMIDCFYASHWLPAHALPLPEAQP